ncbi:hypothetical protein ACLBWX_16425 [Methylobacterium sp. M6A4_1b]
MKRSVLLTRSLSALLLGGLLAHSARAQEEQPPEKPPGPPPSAAEARAERQKNSAAKLAGLLAFVETSCPDLKPNTERLNAVVSGLGVAPDDLAQGDLKLRSQAYTEIYGKDVPANCARAAENFGEAGRTIPGLIAKR